MKVLTGAQRKASLLEVGAKLAAKHGAKNITRRMVAAAGKVSEALVSNYFGDSATAQRAYARKAKAMGLEQPSKDRQDAIGAKLRAHGPRDVRDTRKRSVREVEAIKRKAGAPKKSVSRSAPSPARSMPTSSVTSTARTVGRPGPAEIKPAAPPSTKPAAPPSKPSPAPASAPAQAPPSTKTAARAPKEPPAVVAPIPLPSSPAGSFP